MVWVWALFSLRARLCSTIVYIKLNYFCSFVFCCFFFCKSNDGQLFFYNQFLVWTKQERWNYKFYAFSCVPLNLLIVFFYILPLVLFPRFFFCLICLIHPRFNVLWCTQSSMVCKITWTKQQHTIHYYIVHHSLLSFSFCCVALNGFFFSIFLFYIALNGIDIKWLVE